MKTAKTADQQWRVNVLEYRLGMADTLCPTVQAGAGDIVAAYPQHLQLHSRPMVPPGALNIAHTCPLHDSLHIRAGTGEPCITGQKCAILIDLVVDSNPFVHCFT